MRLRFLAVLVAAVALFVSGPAQAFDTGGHREITLQAMTDEGYNANAARWAQDENWLTDYYTSSPTTLTISSLNQCNLEKLHFDDLFTTQDVTNYWTTLRYNTYQNVVAAANANNIDQFMVALGVSLHAVQDFYTHSDWVEAHSFDAAYHTASWFDAGAPTSPTIFSGYYSNCLTLPSPPSGMSWVPHGGYTGSPVSPPTPYLPSGSVANVAENHDSYVRPNYGRAWIYAYAASREWIYNVFQWASTANAGFVQSNFGLGLNPQLSPSDLSALASDETAQLYISEWVNSSGANGHWQGNRTGNSTGFAYESSTWTAKSNSRYVNAFRSYANAMTTGLYQTPAPSASVPWVTHTVPPATTFFTMQTTAAQANSASFPFAQSFFGVVRLNSEPVQFGRRDGAIQNQATLTGLPWVHFIPMALGAGSQTYTYSLWDEFTSENNDLVPIGGTATAISITCWVPVTTTNPCYIGPYSSSPPSYISNPQPNVFTTTGSGSSGAVVTFTLGGLSIEP